MAEDVPKVRKRASIWPRAERSFEAVFKVNPQQVRVILTQGIKRQVRRVFAALGLQGETTAADPNRHADRERTSHRARSEC